MNKKKHHLGTTYDPKNHLIESVLEGLDHMNQRPREIYVDDNVNGTVILEILDARVLGGRKSQTLDYHPWRLRCAYDS